MGLRTRVSGVAVVLVMLGAAAACGGTDGETPTDAGAAPGMTAYLACLSQNGVTLPSGGAGFGSRGPGARPSGEVPSGEPRPSTSAGAGGPGAGGPGGGGSGDGGPGGGFGGGFGDQAPAGVDQATWTAAQQACSALRPTAGPGGQGGNNSAFAAYRNCLNEHGVTVQAGNLNQLNTADTAVAAAIKVCAPLRPTGQPTPTPTS